MFDTALLQIVEATGAIIGLGLLDSLNPFSIAAMALVLTGTRPLVLGSVFIFTTFAIYLAAGFASFAGWAAILAQFVPLIPTWVLDVGLGAIGFICLGAAWFMWAKRASPGSAMADLVRTSIVGTALYAASSTISDLPTALPYFAAIAVLAEAKLSVAGTTALLLVYNLCYVAPLVLLLGVRLSGKAGVDQGFAKIKTLVDWSFRYLVPPLTACLGIYCLWEVGVRIWG